MLNTSRSISRTNTEIRRSREITNKIWKYRALYIMVLPGLAFFLIFKYWPMWGLLFSFKDYSVFLGFWDSEWVGFKHFERMFREPDFYKILANTFILSFYGLLFYFPFTIALAVMINELRGKLFQRIVQTVVYIPHFVSWVVVAGMTFLLFSVTDGIVNHVLTELGKEPINFLTKEELFRPMIVIQQIWKEGGWGTIIFLAALAGVDPQLYEAAKVDGAGRLRQIWHISLPSIKSTIMILLILRLGDILDVSFEQIFLMLNSFNQEIGSVFETFSYQKGILGGQFSYATAIGFFKSIVGLVMVLGANWLVKKSGEEGIY